MACQSCHRSRQWHPGAPQPHPCTSRRPTGWLRPLLLAASLTVRGTARHSSNPHPFHYFSDPPVVEPGRQNEYGWVQSFKAGLHGLNGTEIVHLTPHAGKLFAGTSFWMSAVTAPSTVVRLDKAGGTWVTETVVFPYAGRTEILKVAKFTTDRHGKRLPSAVELLIAGFYVNYPGEGRCGIVVRNDATRKWPLKWYYTERPWRDNYFSARALESYKDKVTGVDYLFMDAGMPGIIKGWYDPSCDARVSFDKKTESGAFPTRPLNIVTMGGRLYTAGGSFMRRRNDGPHPTWSVVFDMSHHWSGTVDEAVGGLRGITAIPNPSGKGESLLFAWCPNGASKSCMMRLDPHGESFKLTQEACVKDLLGQIFRGSYKNPYSLADYNFALPVRSGRDMVHIIGFESLLFAHSVEDLPTDPRQESITKTGKKLAYYAGGGFIIRRSPQKYEVRVPGGPRPCPMQINPALVSVRCYANSPWDDSIYMGGYDANFFDVLNTAWVLQGTADAVFRRPVPGSLTCTTTTTSTTPKPKPPKCLLCGLWDRRERWLDLSGVDSGRSVDPHSRRKAVDGNMDTWGGARMYIMDMRLVYRVSKLRITWRACKCLKAGTVLLMSSMDGNHWKTLAQPTLYVWGEHRVYPYWVDFHARYFAVNMTELAPLAERFAAFWEIEMYGHPDLPGGPRDFMPGAIAGTNARGKFTCQQLYDYVNADTCKDPCVGMRLQYGGKCCRARSPRTVKGVMESVKGKIVGSVLTPANYSRANSKASSLVVSSGDGGGAVLANIKIRGGWSGPGIWVTGAVVSLAAAIGIASAALLRWNRQLLQPLPASNLENSLLE